MTFSNQMGSRRGYKICATSAVQRITIRVARLQAGLFGDVKFFDGIGELRIDYGPGYRVYFVRRGAVVVLLLCGGDKTTQQRDIAYAKTLAKEN